MQCSQSANWSIVYSLAWSRLVRPEWPALTASTLLCCVQDIADLMMECLSLEPSQRPTVRASEGLPHAVFHCHTAAASYTAASYTPLLLLLPRFAETRNPAAAPAAALVAWQHAGQSPSPLRACLASSAKQAAQVMQRLEGGRGALEAGAVVVPVRYSGGRSSADGGSRGAEVSQ